MPNQHQPALHFRLTSPHSDYMRNQKALPSCFKAVKHATLRHREPQYATEYHQAPLSPGQRRVSSVVVNNLYSWFHFQLKVYSSA